MCDDEIFRGIILVPRDSHIHEVTDLKGKSVAHPSASALAAGKWSAEVAVAIAKILQMDEAQVEDIHLAGMVHDLSKIQVPAEILQNWRAERYRYMLVKQHANNGYERLKTVDYPWLIAKSRCSW